jgi:hypothetical protein
MAFKPFENMYLRTNRAAPRNGEIKNLNIVQKRIGCAPHPDPHPPGEGVL